MAGCESLVSHTAGPDARGRQGRFLGTLIFGPFVVAPALVQGFQPAAGAALAVAALCLVAAAAWLVALRVIASGRDAVAGIAALGGATALAGVIVILLGGMASPAALLLLAVPAEAWWVRRTRRSLTAGAACAAVAVLVVAVLAQPAAVSAWHWFSPVLYLAAVAARVMASQAARPAVSTVRGLPEEALDAVVVHVGPSGEVESVSRQARALLGVEPELLLNTGLFDRIHVADRVAFLCAVAQVREGGGTARAEMRIRMPRDPGAVGGASYGAFEAEIVDAGRADGTVCAIVRDAARLGALRDELARAVDLAGATEVAKGRFLATVSHELRTPLNAIIGFSDMLLHKEISGPLSDKQAEHVTLIREAGNHLLSVVNSILDVSKMESGSYQITPEPFDLAHAVDLSCAMLEPQAAAKGVALAARIPHGLGKVLGDQRAVQQILLNLLSNAVKFTPEGGSVTVNAARRGGQIRLFVNDTGIGIAADDLDKIGRPFMQVHNDYTRQFQGTGLGLSLVKGLVRLHGGTMSIESAPGLGTTVTVGLPAAEEGAAGPDNEIDREDTYGTTLRKIA